MAKSANAEPPRIYRAAVVGLGKIGNEAEENHVKYPGRIIYPHGHAGAFARCARTTLVAAADLSAERREACAARWGVSELYEDYRQMLEKQRIDILSVATPASSHKQIVIDAVVAGVKGILCEKPIATNLRDADEMLGATDSAGVKITINTWRRWEPYYLRAKRLIEDGTIGDLKKVVGHWRGGIIETGSHGYDVINYFVDDEVDWLMGNLDENAAPFNPGADVYIRYKNGVRAFVNGTTGTAAQFEFELFGTTGKIKIGNFHAELFRLMRTSEDPPFDHDLAQLPFPQSGFMTGPMLTGLENLIHCLETGEEPSSSGRMGRLAIAMGLAAYESSVQGNVKIQFPYENYAVDVPSFERPAQAGGTILEGSKSN